jgi:hypothetical protein
MDQRASVMTDRKELINFYPQPLVGDRVINLPQILIVLMCTRGCKGAFILSEHCIGTTLYYLNWYINDRIRDSVHSSVTYTKTGTSDSLTWMW